MPEPLKQLKLFDALSEDGQARLVSACRIARHSQGTSILCKGDAITGAYIILSGRLRVYAVAPNGREATFYFINPGETCLLAVNSLFNGTPYPAWVETLDTCEVGLVDGTTFRQLFTAEPAIQNIALSSLSEIVCRLTDALETVHAEGNEERLIHFLKTQSGADGVVTMTQQEVAGHLGTTREVVARLLGELSARELVTTGRGRIELAPAMRRRP